MLRLCCFLAAVALFAPVSACTDGDSFDVLVLVEQWPITNGGSNSSTFTLHGLWPTVSTSSSADGPCECTDQQFDESALSPIMSMLDVYWPSYQGANADFWSHEWTKHGTCAEQLSSLDSELNFFTGTLKLLLQHNVYDMLSSAGISPSNSKTYTASQIGSAVFQAFGAYGVFSCSGSDLSSVSLCMDTNFGAIHCPSSIKESGCGDSIRLPESN